MKRLVLVVLLILAAGCGASKTPAAVVTKTVSASPTAGNSPSLNVDVSKRDGIFVNLVRAEHFPPLAGATDAQLIKFGNSICSLVPVDATTEQKLIVLKALLKNGFKATDAGGMMAYASALCPEKQSALSIGN